MDKAQALFPRSNVTRYIKPDWYHDALPSWKEFSENLPDIMPIWWPPDAPAWHLFIARFPPLWRDSISVQFLRKSNGGMTTKWSTDTAFREGFIEIAKNPDLYVPPHKIYPFGYDYHVEPVRVPKPPPPPLWEREDWELYI